jgi:hypothetical protein
MPIRSQVRNGARAHVEAGGPPITVRPTVEVVGEIVLTAAELAERLRLPESWVRNRTRARTAKSERIPCIRFGHYVRFLWNSPELQDWISKRRQ